jgi:glycosyltransferase involved in cell wall biosynthesis
MRPEAPNSSSSTSSHRGISVAICSFNGGAFLEKQLESIATQQVLPDEIVISDDGSTDRTIGIIEGFRNKSGLVVHLHRNAETLGSTLNFEKTILRCNGEIIVLADQDDIWMPEKLAKIRQEFAQDPGVALVFSDGFVVDRLGTQIDESLWSSFNFSAKKAKHLVGCAAFGRLLCHNVVTGAAMAFRAEYRDLVTPIPAEWVHDAWIAILIAAVARVKAMPEKLICYRQHPSQQIGTGKRRGFVCRMTDGAVRLECERYLRQTELLRKRMLQHVQNAGYMDLLDERCAHLRARIKILGSSRVMRLKPICREILSRRYTRFSHGIWSAAKDVASQKQG